MQLHLSIPVFVAKKKERIKVTNLSEASNLSLMNFGTKAEANLAGFSLKEEPLSPLANGHDDLSINVVDSDSNGSNSHSPGLRTSLNPKRKRKGEAPQQVISGLISTSTPNFGYVIKQEGGGTTTFAPQQLKVSTATVHELSMWRPLSNFDRNK